MNTEQGIPRQYYNFDLKKKVKFFYSVCVQSI